MAGVIVIGGPTASGKSRLAVALARRFDGEIVNADSQQVYCGMDIGTGKPTPDQRGSVPHHLFDVAEPSEQFDVARFVSAAEAVLQDIASRGRPAFIVGGTGLWIRALLTGLVEAPGRDDRIRRRLEGEATEHGLPSLHERLRTIDPESARRIPPSDPVRIIRALEVHELTGIPLSELQGRHRATQQRRPALQLALDPPRAIVEERIRKRARAMFEQGLLEETATLLREPANRPRLERVMGYREALHHLEGEGTLEQAIEATVIAQRQYAKRQRTWFRSEPEWQWLELPEPSGVERDPLLAAASRCEQWIGSAGAAGHEP